MSAAGLELKSGSANIQNAARDLAVDIERFNQEINALRAEIEMYNKLIATGAGLVGGGVAVGVIGLGLCYVYPPLGGIVLVLGIAMLIGGSVVWAVYAKKIKDANAAILDYQNKIASSQQSILALSTLSTSMDIAVSNANMATKNMTNFASSWLTFGESMQNTVNAIKAGGSTELRQQISLQLNISKAYWEDAKDYADKLYKTPSGVKSVPASEAA